MTEMDIGVCPICRVANAADFFHLPRLPMHVGVTYPTEAEARRAAMGEIALAYCPHCDFAFNRAFKPDELEFLPGYEVQLVHSPVFAKFLAELTARLVERYDLYGKELLDVGCGAGHFLRMLCEAGGNRGIGIDPTIGAAGPRTLSRGSMRLVRGLFGLGESATWQCDFATCQSVLEDVADPVSILANVGRALAPRRGHAYLEVFNAFRAFEAGEVWSLTYEQCNYYSLRSFLEAIRRAGFAIIDSGTCYGDGQYIFVEATPGESMAIQENEPSHAALIRQFSVVHNQRRALWQDRVAEFRQQGKRAAVWGTGGKGICFLNAVGAEDVFVCAVDINPDRQERHIPGTGQRIISPAKLRDVRPDVVVITNPLYEPEIRAAVSELDLQCDFLTI
jgi:SAM-dependent methyltransferase